MSRINKKVLKKQSGRQKFLYGCMVRNQILTKDQAFSYWPFLCGWCHWHKLGSGDGIVLTKLTELKDWVTENQPALKMFPLLATYSFSAILFILLIDSMRSPFGLPAAVFLRFAPILSKIRFRDKERSSWLCRMIGANVPGLRFLWIETGTALEIFLQFC